MHGVVCGAGERHLVIVGGQLAAVFNADIEVARAGAVADRRNAALSHVRGSVDGVEQIAAEITVLVDALGLDGVHLIGDGERHTTQLVHGRIEYFAAITQQPADFTTGHDRCDVDGARATIDLQRDTSRVILAWHRLQFVDGIANHQRLTAAQIDVYVSFTLNKLCTGKG